MYCSTQSPTLGDSVSVLMRTVLDDPTTQVWLRTTFDAEPVFHECRIAAKDDYTTWWQGELTVHNPITHYRFLLADEAGNQRWLTAAGIFDYDVSDSFDFKLSAFAPAPAWTRTSVVYQIFPDRFARSGAANAHPLPHWAVPAKWGDTVSFEGSDPSTPIQFFGGDLDGIVEHLDHLENVGANVVYLTPVFPAESNHRYNASTFDHVDDLLGGDDAYARLSDAIHDKGMKLIGDLTANHTGDTHEWFINAQQDEEAPTRDWYYFHEDGSYETWMGYHTLPKLNHMSEGLRTAMTQGDESVVARWLREPFALDGWRIDVANMSGRLGAIDVNHDVARTIRNTSTDINPEAWVIGEHNHDASTDIDGDGWHGTMNYSGFSWPVWSWVRSAKTEARPFGRPLPVTRRGGAAVQRELDEWRARYGWRAAEQSWNILGSHDSARIRTLTGDAAVHRVAAALLFTLPGVPMIFAGDEFGMEGVNGEDSRRTIPWGNRELGDIKTLDMYALFADLRRTHPALIEGGLRWAHSDDNTLIFVREHRESSLIVCARRTAGQPVKLDAGLLNFSDGSLIATTEGDGGDLPVKDHVVMIPASLTPGAWVWRV